MDSGMNRAPRRPLRKIAIVFLILSSILSIFILRPIFSAPEIYLPFIQSIDERKETVTELATASSVTSAVISACPGDTGASIANQLAELSKSFLIILSVLYGEKYLLPIFGFISFALLFPASFILAACNLIWQDRAWLKTLAAKLLALGLILMLTVPVSVEISNSIERTYHASIDNAINKAMNIEKEFEEADSEEENTWDSITNAAETIVGGVAGFLDQAKNALSRFIEAIAVMIITCCAVPLLVLFFILWAIKMLFNIDYNKITLSIDRDIKSKKTIFIGRNQH